MDTQLTAERQQANLDRSYKKDIVINQKLAIHRLVHLNEKNSGKPKDRATMRFLLQWIYGECKLRWPQITKRYVFDTVTAIDGYEYEKETK